MKRFFTSLLNVFAVITMPVWILILVFIETFNGSFARYWTGKDNLFEDAFGGF